MLADAPGVGADLVGLGVALGRHVAGFLKQRHVNVRFDVARRAGITIPIPRPAEVAANLDDADALDPGLAQPRRGQQPAEAAANDQHVGRIVDGGTMLDVAVRIGVQFLETRDVEVGPAGLWRRPAVALGAITGAQGVDIDHRTFGHAHSVLHPNRPRSLALRHRLLNYPCHAAFSNGR